MFTSVAASVLLGEPFEKLDFIGLSLCLVGVTLLSKPTWLVGVDNSLHLTAEEAYKRTIGVSAAILGEIMASLAYLTVRKLGTKVHFLNHVTYLGICSSIFSFAMSVKLDQLVPLGFTKSTFILLTIGITACTGQCLLNSGLQIAPMGPGSLMRNLDVVFAFIFGITIFHEIPDFYSIAGALLIVGCALSIGLRKILRSKA
jgi:drug/metabolite transporter (DMT)-like permease